MDKRFWGGAIAVLTVVVAGASALPGLLLRPAVEQAAVAGTVEPAPFISRPVKLAAAEPVRPAISPASAGVTEPASPPPIAAAPPLATSPPVAEAPKPAPLAPQAAAEAPQPVYRGGQQDLVPAGATGRHRDPAGPRCRADQERGPDRSRDASAQPAREAAEKPARRSACPRTASPSAPSAPRSIRCASSSLAPLRTWRR